MSFISPLLQLEPELGPAATDMVHYRQTEEEQSEGSQRCAEVEGVEGQEEINTAIRNVWLHGYRGVNAVQGLSWQVLLGNLCIG